MMTDPPVQHAIHKRSVMQIFGVLYVDGLKKLLNKQSDCLWFETGYRSCNVTFINASELSCWWMPYSRCNTPMIYNLV